MSTAFQPNAFQGTGFQIAGGLTTADVEITIGGSQEGESGQLQLRLPITGVPGHSFRFLVYVNGKPHYGTQEEIDELLEELAEQDAEKTKKPRTRIVVQQGKPLMKNEPPPTKPLLIEFQSSFRDYYLKVYAKAKLKEEEDDEDMLLLL